MSRSKWSRALQRRLIAGLIVLTPVAATVWVLRWIFLLLDGIMGDSIYRAIGAATGREELVVPGLGLLALFLVLFITGWVAERTIGRRLIAWWNDLLERLPIVRRIYGAANRIVRTVFGNDTKPFTTVVLVEYPAPGRWSVGFLAGDAPGLAREQVGDTVTVFVPTTPNPTSGWLVLVPRERTRVLPMSVDEAFTFILSAGMVHSDVVPPVLSQSGSP